MVPMLTDTQITPVYAQGRRDISVSAGDTVRVHQKITEKDKTRIQVFEGVVIARKHGKEAGATFTVRRVGSDGVVVEKIFPLYSPMIDRIEVIRRTKMRRSRLYFLRGKTSKQVREKLRRTKIVSETSIETDPAQGSGPTPEDAPHDVSEDVRVVGTPSTDTVPTADAPTSDTDSADIPATTDTESDGTVSEPTADASGDTTPTADAAADTPSADTAPSDAPTADAPTSDTDSADTAAGTPSADTTPSDTPTADAAADTPSADTAPSDAPTADAEERGKTVTA